MRDDPPAEVRASLQLVAGVVLVSPLVELLPATTVLAGVITLASTQVDERLSVVPELVFPTTRNPVLVLTLGRPRLRPLE